jgi:MFS family permease
VDTATTAALAPVRATDPARREAGTLGTLVAVGALLGLAWASSLRGWMTQLVGPESVVTWTGTFVGVLLPGVMVGALLGWAERRRRTDSRRGWLVLAPLLFPAAALSLPGAIHTLVTTGMGGGAIGIALLAMLGGFALSGRGPLWIRVGCGILAFALVPASFLGAPMRPEIDPATPLGAWAATNFSTLFITLALACTIPLRRARGTTLQC